MTRDQIITQYHDGDISRNDRDRLLSKYGYTSEDTMLPKFSDDDTTDTVLKAGLAVLTFGMF